MKSILCFGDSNTWGFNPVDKSRYDRRTRWTGVLQEELGPEHLVIEEGLNGRTTVWDDPIEGHKNGREYLVPCLASHAPLDLVVIMLGTNDLKKRFSLSAFDIAEGVGVLVDTVKASASGPQGRPPGLLVIVPPPLERLSDLAGMFEGAQPTSTRLAEEYGRMARERGCRLLDAGKVVRSSPIDGVHLEPSEHAKLGRAVAAEVRLMTGAPASGAGGRHGER